MPATAKGFDMTEEQRLQRFENLEINPNSKD